MADSLAEKAPPDNPRLHCGTLMQDALAFVHAADLVVRGSPKDLLPAYFLLGCGLEVAYKAYLVGHDATEKDLRAIGHNLETGHRQATGKGLKVTADMATVAGLNLYYQKKALEYAGTGTYRLPELSAVRRTVDEVVNAAYRGIYGKRTYEVRVGRGDAGLVMPEGLWFNPPPRLD